jgi:hypothetical protein
VEAELRAVCLGLVAVVNDPVEQSGVGVVLEQHLNRLPTENLNLEVREYPDNGIILGTVHVTLYIFAIGI